MAALSTVAFAGDSKPVQMTDEQMDQVTAGVGHCIGTEVGNGAPVNNAALNRIEINAEKFRFTTGVQPGSGVCTAGPERNC